jgi:hypothetical protein
MAKRSKPKFRVGQSVLVPARVIKEYEDTGLISVRVGGNQGAYAREGGIMIDPEIRDIKVQWVTLPGAMNGERHLYVAQTHGDNSVTELWLTEKQAQVAAACAQEKAAQKGEKNAVSNKWTQ